MEHVLKRHQRTAKYCLKLQDKNTTSNSCENCGKTYGRQDHLRRHQKTCTATKDATISRLAQKIDNLADAISKLADKPNDPTAKTSTNNRIMNLAPVTDEAIKEHLDRLTIDLIEEGGKGYAIHAGHYPYKDKIICTDKARKKLRWKDENNELVNDAGGVKLTQHFFKQIAKRNEELITAEYADIQRQVQDIAITQTAGTSNLVELLQRSTFLQDILAKSRQAADGRENELTKDFVRHLSRMI